MLDAVACSRVKLAEVASVEIAALESLDRLLIETVEVDTTSASLDPSPDERNTVEQKGAATRIDGAGRSAPSVVDATGELPPEGGRAPREAAAQRARQHGRRGGRR